MQQIAVHKGSNGQVTLTYPDSDHPPLEMNFEPLLTKFNLSSGLLLHWQAKPFGVRCWGVYDIASGNYTAVDWDKIHFDFVQMQTYQLNEVNYPGVKPTAVLYFRDCKLENKKGYYEVKRHG